jgi:uncharacterized protein (TIGR03382 family)
MKAMHVRVVAVMVLLCVVCGRAEASRDDDMMDGVSALTWRTPVVENPGTWSGSGTQGGWVWPGATNGNVVTGQVVVAVNLTGGTRPIPEPSATMLVGVGLLALLVLGRRRH